MEFSEVFVCDAFRYGGIERSPSTYKLIGTHSGNQSLDAAIEWLGALNDKPSEAQVILWEEARVAGINANEALNASLLSISAGVAFSKSEAIIALQVLDSLVVQVNDTIASTYAYFVSALNNTTLEDELMAHITKYTGITVFNPGALTDNEKQTIITHVIIYLQAGLNRWYSKLILRLLE